MFAKGNFSSVGHYINHVTLHSKPRFHAFATGMTSSQVALLTENRIFILKMKSMLVTIGEETFSCYICSLEYA